MSFINEYVWKVNTDCDSEYFLVESVFKVDSTENILYELQENVIIIPESLINDLHKLDDVDYSVINSQRIPILKCDKNNWYIDLKHYDSFMRSNPS